MTATAAIDVVSIPAPAIGSTCEWLMASAQGPKSFNCDRCWVLPDTGLYVVADGAGPPPAGDAASIAGKAFSAAVLNEMANGIQADHQLVTRAFAGAIDCAQKAVLDFSAQVGEPTATTLTAAVVLADRIVVCSVGDSSAQLVAAHATEPLQQQFFEGDTVPPFLGTRDFAPTITTWDLEEPSTLVLATDGWTLSPEGADTWFAIDLATRVHRSADVSGDNATVVVTQVAPNRPRRTTRPGRHPINTETLPVAHAVLSPLRHGNLQDVVDPAGVLGRINAAGISCDSLSTAAALLDSDASDIRSVVTAAFKTLDDQWDAR